MLTPPPPPPPLHPTLSNTYGYTSFLHLPYLRDFCIGNNMISTGSCNLWSLKNVQVIIYTKLHSKSYCYLSIIYMNNASQKVKADEILAARALFVICTCVTWKILPERTKRLAFALAFHCHGQRSNSPNWWSYMSVRVCLENVKLYYTRFEITGGPCNLIGSDWCDLFTNPTIFCFKSHLFPSQWAGHTKNKITNQISRLV